MPSPRSGLDSAAVLSETAPRSAKHLRLRRLRSNALLNLVVGWLLLSAGLLVLTQLQGLPLPAAAQALALFGILAAFVLINLPLHLPHDSFGPANGVTLARAVLVCLLAGLAGWISLSSFGWFPLAAATTVLCLDGVDGWLARRTGCASPFGSRFDMEVDALFLIVLSLLCILAGKAGIWVLLVALPHYLFRIAGCRLPWLQHPLPPRLWRKTLFVGSAILLVLCLAPPLQPPLTGYAAALAAALVLSSFLRDLLWLHRQSEAP